MNENQKTIGFIVVAAVLLVLAFILSPGRITPDAFLDQGEPFFPDFTDPNEATMMEVVSFDETTGAARPFKVMFENGQWVIPSHYNYPADARDRLAQTAAGVIDIKKDDYRTDNVADHEGCGVVDPLDETATSLTGRGQRVTLKGLDDKVLADFIIGKKVSGRDGFRFVRIPGQKRVYAVRMNIDISTDFTDWIDTDQLKVNKNEIEKIVLKDYSINERTMSVDTRDNLELTLKDREWSANNMRKTDKVDTLMIAGLLSAIDSLNIVGVRPKPEGLATILLNPEGNQSISRQDQMSLQNKGFFFTRTGQLFSNEGELQVYTDRGVTYTLRFGEVLFGSGSEADAGVDENPTQKGTAENRYLFITAELNEKALTTDEEKETARKLVNEANNRFAKWFYVISSRSFDNLRLTRSDLVVKN
ncbi:MAG: DUF4340 domain-containing protein [Candidatus Zixiibacteriota bacterium]